MEISLIVAVDAESGIGKNNDLMWNLPRDMQFFKETTSGHIVVMGRKNYESIPERFRPLPNRENAVLSRNSAYDAPGALVFASLEDCLAHYQQETERIVFIIGGGQIFKEALDKGVVTEMYVSHISKAFDADTFFPAINAAQWEVSTVLEYPADEKHEAGFVVKKYVKR